MVGPISEAERSAFNRRLKAAVTLLVGASAGLITLQVDTTLLQTVAAIALGVGVGYLLARFVVPSGPAPATRQRRRRVRENPFADGDDDEETARARESGSATSDDTDTE